MAIRLVCEVKVSGILNMSRRTFNNIMTAVWDKAGRTWHREYRPKHFTTAGAREYGYVPRSKGYMLRKAKGYVAREKKGGPGILMSGHQRPLVWTGISEKAAERLSLKSTSQGVTVHVPAPRLNWRPGGGTMNLADEMTRISEGEGRDITKFVEETLTRAMESQPGVTVRRIGETTWVEGAWASA